VEANVQAYGKFSLTDATLSISGMAPVDVELKRCLPRNALSDPYGYRFMPRFVGTDYLGTAGTGHQQDPAPARWRRSRLLHARGSGPAAGTPSTIPTLRRSELHVTAQLTNEASAFMEEP
jgi:hypothetical protein